MPMPKQLQPDAYCSAPPLSTTTLWPPRISHDIKVRRPRAPVVHNAALGKLIGVSIATFLTQNMAGQPLEFMFSKAQTHRCITSVSNHHSHFLLRHRNQWGNLSEAGISRDMFLLFSRVVEGVLFAILQVTTTPVFCGFAPFGQKRSYKISLE